MVYSLVIFFMFIITLLNLGLNKNQKYFTTLLMFLFLFFFSSFRGSGDGDYFTYLEYSKAVTSIETVLNNNFPMEIGFRVISYIGNLFNFSSQFVIMVMNLISLILIFKFIMKYSQNWILSIFLFLPHFFMFDMHAARTAVAIGITTLSIKYLFKGNIWKYSLIIFLASCFHSVALVMLPVYFFRKYSILKFTNIFLIIILIPFSYLIDFLNLIIFFSSQIGIGNITEKLLNYSSSLEFGYPFNLLDPRFLLLLLFFSMAVYLFNSKKPDKFVSMWSLMVWVAMILILLLRSNTFITYRSMSFYNLYLILLIPEILLKIKDMYGKVVYLIAYILISVVYLVFCIVLVRGYPEYVFFFNNNF